MLLKWFQGRLSGRLMWCCGGFLDGGGCPPWGGSASRRRSASTGGAPAGALIRENQPGLVDGGCLPGPVFLVCRFRFLFSVGRGLGLPVICLPGVKVCHVWRPVARMGLRSALRGLLWAGPVKQGVRGPCKSYRACLEAVFRGRDGPGV